MRRTNAIVLVAAAVSVGCGAQIVASHERPEEAGMRMEEQRPRDPEAVGDMMTQMERQADAVIERAEPGSDPKAAYRRGALEIMRQMRPRFGPANAWLFGERGGKLGELADKLGIARDEDMDALFQEHVYETFLDQFEALETAAAAAGFTVSARPADRAELLWTPLLGYALSVTDTSAKVKHKPPYAGTVAGPDVPEVETHPHGTLYCFPPVEGSAEMSLMTREQPGRPAFFTGELVAMVLQEPQSGDVRPDAVFDKLIPELERGGLIRSVDDEQLAAINAQLTWPVDGSNGVVSASIQEEPPADLTLPVVCALLWVQHGGTASRLTLLFPPVGP